MPVFQCLHSWLSWAALTKAGHCICLAFVPWGWVPSFRVAQTSWCSSRKIWKSSYTLIHSRFSHSRSSNSTYTCRGSRGRQSAMACIIVRPWSGRWLQSGAQSSSLCDSIYWHLLQDECHFLALLKTRYIFWAVPKRKYLFRPNVRQD